MLVTWLGHAQLFINAAGRTLLVDPWFVEPVFAGAWFRYPPPPYPDSSTVPRPDFVLLSQARPDHAGPRTLERLSADSTVVAVPFASGVLQRRLSRSHLPKIDWLEAWQRREVSSGLAVTFVPHDGGREIASIVVEADGVRLYLGSDNALSLEGYRAVVERLGKVDLAFLPFARASSYPTGFEASPQALRERCATSKADGVRRFQQGIEGLQPAEAVPYASSWALLEQGELWKNFLDRPTPDEALKAAMEPAMKVGTHLLRMEPGDQWSPSTGAIAKGLTDGWGYDAKSIERYAMQQAARVSRAISAARAPMSSVSTEALDAAFRDYFAQLLEQTRARTAPLNLRAGFEAEGVAAWRVSFAAGQAPVIEPGLAGDEAEVLILPAAELWAVLTTAASWQDAWYGYRLRVRQSAGAGDCRALWDMLLDFDDEALSLRLAQTYAR